eukprot:Polyplicarium_translucidae@DN855_c0_g1_i1.p1
MFSNWSSRRSSKTGMAFPLLSCSGVLDAAHLGRALGHALGRVFERQCIKSRCCFEAPVSKSVAPANLDVAANLKALAPECSKLVLWLDCDREGENIAMEVAEICRSANPRMEVARATFSALTKRDLETACNRLGLVNQQLSDAVDVRQELDLRAGAAFTRFLTLRYQNRFELPPGIISYGPCQFPTLGFVVQRYLDIQKFQRETFWSIHLQATKDHQGRQANVEFSWKRQRLYDRHVVLVLYELCLEQPSATVTDVSGRRTSRRKPLPLSTVEMSKLACQKLRLSSHRCMQVAEQLYCKGYLSYPRTETDRYADTIDLKALVTAMVPSSEWGAYASGLLSGGYDPPRAGTHDDHAHPPIHPVMACERYD